MTDLIERLRNFEGSDALGNGDFSLLQEAAAALEAAQQRYADGLEAWKANNAHFAARIAELREAGQAVVDRWDTPLWKDVPTTAEYINRLRALLTAVERDF